MVRAGAPGFEPRSTDPKSGVLPLHHAPKRANCITAGSVKDTGRVNAAQATITAGQSADYLVFTQSGLTVFMIGSEAPLAGLLVRNDFRIGGLVRVQLGSLIPKSVNFLLFRFLLGRFF